MIAYAHNASDVEVGIDPHTIIIDFGTVYFDWDENPAALGDARKQLSYAITSIMGDQYKVIFDHEMAEASDAIGVRNSGNGAGVLSMKDIDQQRIEAIADELAAHNEDIGAGDRNPEAILRDARYVDMVRNCGISLETLAMMATDHRDAAARYRNQLIAAGIEPAKE